MTAMTVGSIVGGAVPTMMGADMFSLWPALGSAVGGAVGIWASYRYLHS